MSSKSKFVVMKHNADKAGLHYDLRYKMSNSNNWNSFAVRKGVPTEIGKKVLAVKTTIHTESEALFTGKIKKGEYGAGTLSKEDGGSCEIIKDTKKHIALDLKGSKYKGLYHLISTGFVDKDYKKPTYFLFKGREQNIKK